MQPELRFVPKPVPSPPRIVGPSGGQLIRPSRGFPVGGAKISPSAAGGSLPLPPIPPMPPIPWGGLGYGAGVFGLLVLLDLLFPAPLADGELPWNDDVLDPGLQPLPERAPVPGIPVQSLDGEFYYDAVSSITYGTQRVLYNARYDTLDIQEPKYSKQYFTLYPEGSSVEVLIENTRAEYIFECTDCDGENSYPSVQTTVRSMLWQPLEDPSVVGKPNGRIEVGWSQIGWSTDVTWVEDVEYYRPDQLEPGAWPPGPYTPQPPPTQEGTGITTQNPTPLIWPGAAPATTAPMPQEDPARIAPRRRRGPTTKPAEPVPPGTPITPPLEPAVAPTPVPQIPPLPAVAPAPAPPNTEGIDLDGLPIPAPGIVAKATSTLKHFPWPGSKPVNPAGVAPTLKGIADEVGRIEQKVAQIGGLVQLFDIAGLIDAINGLGDPKEFEPDTWTLTGICEALNDDGKQPVFSTPVKGGAFPDAAMSRLDAIQYLLQAHLGYKTPTCNGKPQLAPYWRSIRFESDEKTDNGRNVARKLLRYRGSRPGDVDYLAGYWSDFEWTTGAVCVFHKGSPVGTPQVWASTEEEGKRVLRHAFGEAGFDADQIGQWGVSSSSNPRYGVSHRVKLKVVDGCWSATSRPGSDGWPEAGIV